MSKDSSIFVNLPRDLRRCLSVMAVQDLREPENFLHWLIACEAQRRGMLPPSASNFGAPETQPERETAHVAAQA